MLLQIILHTPRWVCGLFVLLLALGVPQLFANERSLLRVTLIPVAMDVLSFYGTVSVFGDSLLSVGAWIAAMAVALTLVLRQPLPATTCYDAVRRRFRIAGSPIPLILVMGLFLTKYSIGVALALHPELHQRADFGLVVPMVYGAFSGIFAARATQLWRLAVRADPVAGAESFSMTRNREPS